MALPTAFLGEVHVRNFVVVTCEPFTHKLIFPTLLCSVGLSLCSIVFCYLFFLVSLADLLCGSQEPPVRSSTPSASTKVRPLPQRALCLAFAARKLSSVARRFLCTGATGHTWGSELVGHKRVDIPRVS